MVSMRLSSECFVLQSVSEDLSSSLRLCVVFPVSSFHIIRRVTNIRQYAEFFVKCSHLYVFGWIESSSGVGLVEKDLCDGWLSASSDLRPCDFWPRGVREERVYSNQPKNV